MSSPDPAKPEAQTTDPGALWSVPVCSRCGSDQVVVDAWASWNPLTGFWELEDTFDHAWCKACDAEADLHWVQSDIGPRLRIRALNDRFRTRGEGNGSLVVTEGVAERGPTFVLKALGAVRGFTDFSEDNDPWGEHDFGAVMVDGQKLFWKLDYYDRYLAQGSEDPANEGLTHRVLTIMLAEEY